MKMAILFWFYKEPEICKNRLDILKKYNPDVKIYGLFGGDINEAEKYEKLLSPFLDDFYTCPYEDRDWKWINGDLMLLDWYEKRGKNLAWDSIAVVQWDLLVFDSLQNQFPNIKKSEIYLSGLKRLDKKTEMSWHWTMQGSKERENYLAFLSYVKEKYNYDKKEPPCCLFIFEIIPRIFFEKYITVKKKQVGMLEYKIPIYAEIFNIPFYNIDKGVCWDSDYEHYPLNAVMKELTSTYINEQLEYPKGWRIFHPYYKSWGSNEMVMRRYQSSDKEKVKELYRFASIHSEIGYRDGPWYKDFEDIEGSYFNGGEFLVGAIQDEIVAIGGYKKISDKMGHVRRMRVHPNFRRMGFAQKIIQGLEKEAIRNGLDELRLRTSTQQLMAQHFYEKNGFSKMETEKEFYKEGGGNTFEVIWYRKQLK